MYPLALTSRQPKPAPAPESMHYFFYGTLCDSDIRQLVLGYRPGPRQLRPASLAGFRRKQARGRSYPVLIRSPGGRVDGLLFSARPADVARLTEYESPEYRACQLPVRGRSGTTRRAWVFLPACGPAGTALPASHADWHSYRWRRHEKPAFLRSLQSQGFSPCATP